MANTSAVMQNQDFQIQQQKLNVALATYYIYMLKKMCIVINLYESWTLEKNTGNTAYFQAPIRLKPIKSAIFGAQNTGFTKTQQISFKAQIVLYSSTVALSKIVYDTLGGPGGLALQLAFINEQQLTAMNEGMEDVAIEDFYALVKNSFTANPTITSGAVGVYDNKTAMTNFMYFRSNDVPFYHGEIIDASRDIATKGRVLQAYANVTNVFFSETLYSDPEFKSVEDYGEIAQAFTYTEVGSFKRMRYLISTNTPTGPNSGGVYQFLSLGSQAGLKINLADGGGGAKMELPKNAGSKIDFEFMKAQATPLSCTVTENILEKPTVDNSDMAIKYLLNVSVYLGYVLFWAESSASVKSVIA